MRLPDILIVALFGVFLTCAGALADTLAAEAETVELDRIEALYARQQWPEGVALAEPARFPTEAGRIQARYLLALGLWHTGSAAQAEAILRDILSRYPDLARVRLTLAAVLASRGRLVSARHNYGMLRGNLGNPGAAAYVDRAIAALDAGKPWSVGVSLGLAGSTNINAGVDAEEVRIGSLVARPGALNRRRSGPGADWSASAAWQHRLDAERTAVLRLDVRQRDYSGSAFDSTQVRFAPGIRKAAGQGVLGIDALTIANWASGVDLGLTPMAIAVGPRLTYLGPVGKAWHVDLEASLLLRDDRLAPARSGVELNVSTQLERPLTTVTSLILRTEIQALASESQTETYAAIGQAIGLYRDWPGGWSTYGEVGLTMRGHAGAFPFADVARHDASGSARLRIAQRDLRLFGFAPYLQLQYDRTESNIDLYDHKGFTVFNGWTQSF